MPLLVPLSNESPIETGLVDAIWFRIRPLEFNRANKELSMTEWSYVGGGSLSNAYWKGQVEERLVLTFWKQGDQSLPDIASR